VEFLHQQIFLVTLMKVELVEEHLFLEIDDYVELKHQLSFHFVQQLID
jgi:hypothetical protein